LICRCGRRSPPCSCAPRISGSERRCNLRCRHRFAPPRIRTIFAPPCPRDFRLHLRAATVPFEQPKPVPIVLEKCLVPEVSRSL
jgi:hypothetical protein